GIEPIANFQFLRAYRKARNEFPINTLVHRDAAGGRAPLSRGAKSAPDRAIDGQIEIGVLHHQNNVLAAHLQRATFEIWRAGLRNNASDSRGAGETDDRNVLVLSQRRACS